MLTPRARWWGPHVLLAGINVAAAGLLAWSGQGLSAFLAIVLGINMLLARATQRHAHVSAWCRGYEDGLSDMSAYRAGAAPSSLVRQRVTGSIAPEPWEDR